MSYDNDRLGQVLSKIDILTTDMRTFSADMTSLTRTVDRIDQRLIEVEGHTSLIPGISEAIGSHSTDLDNHEQRLKQLKKKPA